MGAILGRVVVVGSGLLSGLEGAANRAEEGEEGDWGEKGENGGVLGEEKGEEDVGCEEGGGVHGGGDGGDEGGGREGFGGEVIVEWGQGFGVVEEELEVGERLMGERGWWWWLMVAEVVKLRHYARNCFLHRTRTSCTLSF